MTFSAFFTFRFALFGTITFFSIIITIGTINAILIAPSLTTSIEARIKVLPNTHCARLAIEHFYAFPIALIRIATHSCAVRAWIFA